MHATQVEIHPAATIFPMMGKEAFEELKRDIRDNGVKVWLTFYDGKLIDGRNRLKAMQELGIDWTHYSEEIDVRDDFDPTKYVLSTNLHRRHLSTSERAAIAANLLDVFADEAKERMKLNNASKEIFPESQKGQARDKAGEALNVSGRSVEKAKQVKAKDPELFESVLRGETSVSEAYEKVSPPKPPKEKPSKFNDIRSYVDTLDAADKGCINELFMTIRDAGIESNSMPSLVNCIIDWTNK